MSEILFSGGIIICGIAVIGALISIIILRFMKIHLNKQFDIEYGKRRR